MANNQKQEPRCDGCRHYVKLPEPFHYDKEGYPTGITVYGFCTKDVTKNFSFYPVYLPDGGVCKAFKPRPWQGKTSIQLVDGQLSLEV